MIKSIPSKLSNAKLALLATAISVSLLLSACSEKPQEEVIETVIRPVFTEIITPTQVSDLYFNGTVQSASQAELSFRTNGQLIELLVGEGSQVNKGDVLAKIDSTDAEIALASTQNELENARIEYERANTLFERLQSISQSQLDELTLMYNLAKNRVSEAQRRVEDTMIKAPFSGIVSRRFVNNHVAIQANEPIISIHDLSSMEVVINVPESVMTREGYNPEIKATSALTPGIMYQLSVKKYETEPDPVTRTYAITLAFDNLQNSRLLPGMNVRVFSDSVEGEAYITVPLSAITPDNLNNQHIWIVDANNTLQKRTVEVGSLHGDRVQIKSQLNTGEQVVVAGILGLTEGLEVRPMQNEAK
ncbi:efflux RND transporter periplasmic adaptor subunit [Shewanella maritima]|uniref:efflux RND transporter periplasmic adaptor subunit n=1 Tax=Shewanella maritima TaxID=2520507 RepID=UPI003735DE68